MLERDSRRWLDVLFNVTLSYNICRHETTNRVPWTVFHGSPPLQYYYAAEETPFSQLTPFQKESLEQRAPSSTDWEHTYFALQEKRAEITAYVKSRQNSRASKLIEQSEKQLQSARLSVGAKVLVRTELPNRHGAVRQRKKFEAPLREDPATILEYTKSNRYLVQFQDGTTKHYARRWLKLISNERNENQDEQDGATESEEETQDCSEEETLMSNFTSELELPSSTGC
jgi:hypothetical protein